MNKLLDKLFNGGYSKDFYQKHRDAIQKNNSNVVGLSMMVISLFTIAFIAVDMMTHLLNIHIISYVFFILFLLIMIFIHILFTKDNYNATIAVTSVFVIGLEAFVIFIETYVMPDRTGSLFFALLVAIPVTIIAPPFVMMSFDLIGFVAFIILSFIFKEKSIFLYDALLGLGCLVSGVSLGEYVLFNKFKSFDLNEKLRYRSRYDSLTNIYNRRAGDVKLEEVMKTENRIALAMIDIDDFKQYNDTYGHLKGDEVLRTIASIFLYHVKKLGYFVSRFGGEEFMLVTFGDGVEEMEQILNRAATDFRLANLVDKNSKTGYVTFSAGYTKVDGCKDANKIINAADKGLYQAKNSGKNAIVYYEFNEE